MALQNDLPRVILSAAQSKDLAEKSMNRIQHMGRQKPLRAFASHLCNLSEGAKRLPRRTRKRQFIYVSVRSFDSAALRSG